MVTIKEFIAMYGIKMKRINRIYQNPHTEDFKGDHWEVVLHTPGQGIDEFVTYFSKGFGYNGKKPTVAEVLDCIASDAMGYENTKNFEDWATEYGYNISLRRTETIYENVKNEVRKLKNFLEKEAYETLLWETERM